MNTSLYIMAAFFVFWSIAYPRILFGFLKFGYRDSWTDYLMSAVCITYGLGTIGAIVVFFR